MVIFSLRALLSECFSLAFIPHYVIYKNSTLVQTKDAMCKARKKKITQDCGREDGEDKMRTKYWGHKKSKPLI